MRLRDARCLPILLALAACATPAPKAVASTGEAKAEASTKADATEVSKDISLGESAPQGQLPPDVRPRHYTLALDLDPAVDRFSGTAEIALALENTRSSIWMHGRGLHVSEASLELPTGERIPARWTQVDDTGVAKLELARAAGPGAATLHIAWDAPFDPQLVGIYKSHAAKHDYVFSKFEATYARRAFPSFDEPGVKTPFAISMTVPERDQAISNFPQISEAPAGAGKKRVVFAETPPLPTYLVLFVAGELDIVSTEVAPNRVRATPLPLRAIAPLGGADKLQAALREGQISIDELETEYGLPFPYAKIDLIAVPDFQSGAMENAGGITFRDNLLLIDEATASLDQRKTLASVIAHELAHQWFGDLVTMQWWDDIWLNEGFATFMASRVLEVRHPELQEDLDVVRAAGEVMSQDELVSARKIRQPITSTHDITNAFDGITYEKGAAVLGMFERWMGKDKFLAGVSADLRAHANGNATTGDLLAALSSSAGFDVRGPFESFLDRSGVPLVEARVQCKEKTGSLHLRQSRSLPLGSTGARNDPADKWQVPVCIRYGIGGKLHQSCALLIEKEQEMALEGCPDWVLPNADAAGYYRWSLAPADLNALREKGFKSLTTGERISYAQNLVSAFRSGALPADAVLAALLPLAGDASGAVAEQPMGILQFVHDEVADVAQSGERAKADSKALQAAIESVAGKLYRPLLEGKGGLGWRAQPGESTERRDLREGVIGFLSRRMNDAEVHHHLAQLGFAYLGTTAVDPTAVDADLVQLALIAALSEGDAKFFAAVQARLFASEDGQLRQRLLIALSETRDRALAASARAISFDPHLRQNERFLPYLAQLGDVRTRAAAWASLQEKFDALAPLLPDRYAGFLLRSIRFCDAADLESVKTFFTPRAASINGGPRNLASVLEEGQLCAARVEAQGPSARAFFRSGK